jgi:uncharacterized protein
MSGDASALYAGTVMHQRLRPRRHRLRYRVFSLLLDLDELDGVAARLRLFSRNRFNLFSFFDRDHGDGSSEPLRVQIERQLMATGIELNGGPIRLLTMPRVLGYVFNPLSVYFCYRRASGLAAIVYEVNNTFGERHNYLIPVSGDSTGTIHQECAKRFFVSPFLDMDIDYSFRVIPPGSRVGIAISGRDTHGPIIVASLFARRAPLSDTSLALAFVTYPLLTLKVIAGIHWEALRIWLKGVRLRDRAPAPGHSFTSGRPIDAKDTSGHVA